MASITDGPAALADPALRAELALICKTSQITELAVFGSAIRGELRPGSDVDVLITFAGDARPSLFDLNHISEELERIFGRPVDVVTRAGIEHSRRRSRRDEILSTAQVICGSA